LRVLKSPDLCAELSDLLFLNLNDLLGRFFLKLVSERLCGSHGCLRAPERGCDRVSVVGSHGCLRAPERGCDRVLVVGSHGCLRAPERGCDRVSVVGSHGCLRAPERGCDRVSVVEEQSCVCVCVCVCDVCVCVCVCVCRTALFASCAAVRKRERCGQLHVDSGELDLRGCQTHREVRELGSSHF
jgi:hypothetical protein